MNPELQEMVQNVLKRHGYEGEANYDEVAETYDFTAMPKWE